MRLELIRRPEPSRAMALLSPLIAVALTVATIFIVFTLYGIDPLRGLYIYFIAPLTEGWSREELVVKATPLILIASGLAVGYLSNNWNIGAEGQFTIGAITGSMLPILVPGLPEFRDAAADAGDGRARRRGLCDDPGAAEGAVRNQRDPDQPDAGLCRDPVPRLGGARTLARSDGLRIPEHRFLLERRIDPLHRLRAG